LNKVSPQSFGKPELPPGGFTTDLNERMGKVGCSPLPLRPASEPESQDSPDDHQH
jgi:hypothetical protein